MPIWRIRFVCWSTRLNRKSDAKSLLLTVFDSPTYVNDDRVNNLEITEMLEKFFDSQQVDMIAFLMNQLTW